MTFVHPRLDSALIDPALLTPGDRVLPVGVLADLTARIAAATDTWRPIVRHDPSARWYGRLLLADAVEMWLIGWTDGQATDVHDHGGAVGALAVAEGELREEVFDRAWQPTAERWHRPGRPVRFGVRHVHRVSVAAGSIATSVHAYSPPQLPLGLRPSASGIATPSSAYAEPGRPAALSGSR